LQVATGIEPSTTVYKEADVNGDNKIGMEEVLFILQRIAVKKNRRIMRSFFEEVGSRIFSK